MSAQDQVPPIPPNCDFFKNHVGALGNQDVVFVVDDGMEFYCYDETPPRRRTIIAAVAVEHWQEAFKHGEAEDAVRAMVAINAWRNWALMGVDMIEPECTGDKT